MRKFQQQALHISYLTILFDFGLVCAHLFRSIPWKTPPLSSFKIIR
uniref:Uncharacterized protein n=1 Tax=Rhizophora mucronata TaxID=61149 RepID=A0A2P2NWR9_RHIMU